MKFIKKLKAYSLTIIIIFCIIFIFTFISGYFSERVEVYVRQKVKVNTSIFFEQVIREAVVPNINTDVILLLNKNNENKITSVIINTKEVNNIMASVLECMKDNFYKIENNEELHNLSLPFGIVLSDTLFSNLGPNIKIHIRQVGSFAVDIVTIADNYGINNSLLEVVLISKVEFLVLIPFKRQLITVDIKVPLVIELLSGEVPRYYYYLHNATLDPSIPEIE